MNPSGFRTTKPNEATQAAATEKVCCWCLHGFDTVPELLDHVVDEHLNEPAAAAAA